MSDVHAGTLIGLIYAVEVTCVVTFTIITIVSPMGPHFFRVTRFRGCSAKFESQSVVNHKLVKYQDTSYKVTSTENLFLIYGKKIFDIFIRVRFCLHLLRMARTPNAFTPEADGWNGQIT